MECQYCQSACIKYGKQKDGTQRYYCKHCQKTQQSIYQYKACIEEVKSIFIKCLKNNVSLSGIRRITGISITTQLKYIRKVGKSIIPEPIYRQNDVYEVDELKTYG